MKILYTQSEFDAAKSRDKLPLECICCSKTFHRTKHDIKSALNGTIHNTYECCSKRCGIRHHFRFSSHMITCDQCGKPLKKKESDIKKSKHHFCSHSCSAKYSNAHKTKGTRISKLERWLAEQLVILFPSLEFHFNRKDAINGELDIFIPSLKLAFELNGIFHYEPIYGPEKLSSIQTNDHRKMLACAEHSIELCILDVSSVSYFKPTKVQKFLDIISNIINLRLSRDLPVNLPLSS